MISGLYRILRSAFAMLLKLLTLIGTTVDARLLFTVPMVEMGAYCATTVNADIITIISKIVAFFTMYGF